MPRGVLRSETEVSVSQNLPTGSKRKRGRPPKMDETETRYRCGVCSKEFKNLGNLNAHLGSHKDERPFCCEYSGCGKTFVRKQNLVQHELVHRGVKPFVCAHCTRGFSSNAALREHTSRHDNQRPHACATCHKTFRQASALHRHIAIHSPSRPFSCQFCGRRFSLAIYLRSHLKTHTGERPYKCGVCDRAFAHISDVKRHQTTHTGERPYKCDLCAANFTDASSRRRHMRDHPSGKPYACHVCHQTFRRATQLRGHRSCDRDSQGTPTVLEIQDAEGGGRGGVDQRTYVTILHRGRGGKAYQRDGSLIGGSQSAGTEDGSGSVRKIGEEGSDGERFTVGLGVTSNAVDGDEIDENTKNNGVGVAPSGEAFCKSGEYDVDQARGSAETGVERVRDCETMCVLVEGDDGVGGVNDLDECEDMKEGIVARSQGDGWSECRPADSSDENASLSKGSVMACRDDRLDRVTRLSEPVSERVFESGHGAPCPPRCYVVDPDFTSQGYYDWLHNFTESCKGEDAPLGEKAYRRISTVARTLTDVMACPGGVLQVRGNYAIVMGIVRDLQSVLARHMDYTLCQLDSETS